MIQAKWQAQCDVCYKVVDTPLGDAITCAKSFRKQGWSVSEDGTFVVCRACVVASRAPLASLPAVG